MCGAELLRSPRGARPASERKLPAAAGRTRDTALQGGQAEDIGRTGLPTRSATRVEDDPSRVVNGVAEIEMGSFSTLTVDRKITTIAKGTAA